MGYFANGTEGEEYFARYCARCVHEADPLGCEVWTAHLLANYEECNKADSILHRLIPRSLDGLSNDPCRMFLEVLDWPLSARRIREAGAQTRQES